MPLDELLATADAISLHVRLNDTTRGMIGADQFARMKRGAIVINTARGGVIDEPSLLNALSGGQIGGAGLDVFAQEPLPAGPSVTRDGECRDDSRVGMEHGGCIRAHDQPKH